MNQPTQQSNLELMPSVTFAAGETKLFFVSGSYFELIDCASPVDVLLTDRSGGQRARMIGAAQTHHVKNTPYEAIQITSASNQAIRFAYGSGEAGTRNTAGSVNVLNAVALDAATLAALESIDLNAATINALAGQYSYGTSNFNTVAAFVANTPVQIFAPAANINGCRLHQATLMAGAPSAVIGSILAKSGAAPASVTDGDNLGTGRGYYTAGSNPTSFVETAENILIPAGKGLWAICNAGANGKLSARYTLL